MRTWGLDRLRAREAWKAGFTGEGVIVGHLDTGVDGKHPALKGAIASFAEFDFLGERIPGAKPRDSDEHGTHTAGTIVGREVDGSQFGVAPGAKLASALVIEGGNIVARILGGMDWIVGEGAKVLSMSLGIRGFHDEFLPLMQAIRNRGVLPVIAAGNEGAGTSRSPGNYDNVLSIGACDENDRIPSFSSSQRIVRPIDPLVPDIVAPGRRDPLGASRRPVRAARRDVDGDAPRRGARSALVAGEAGCHRQRDRVRDPRIVHAADDHAARSARTAAFPTP